MFKYPICKGAVRSAGKYLTLQILKFSELFSHFKITEVRKRRQFLHGSDIGRIRRKGMFIDLNHLVEEV
jgi:hypothetical protein